MKRNILLFSVVLALLCFSVAAVAQKPKWVGNLPQASNSSYRFVEVVSFGTTERDAAAEARLQLAQNEQVRQAVTVSVESGELSTTEGDKTVDKSYIKVMEKGKSYPLQANLVDSWVESRSDGGVRLHSLYQVAVKNNPQFDVVRTVDTYGVTPVVMSIVPGLGQIYKGSTLKGIALFAGTALCAGGALYCENQRKDYRNKVVQQPKFAKDYNDKASSYETGRNVLLGAAAAVWVYNLIDAAVAKGARRVVIDADRDRSLSLLPVATPEGAGLTLAFRF